MNLLPHVIPIMINVMEDLIG